MWFITHAVEAQLHREVYVAMINSWARKKPGRKRELALRAGITPNYLSYILKLDIDPYTTSDAFPIMRTPSARVAQRIARVFPAPQEIRESLLWHMTLANEKRVRASDSARTEVPRRPPVELISEIKNLHSQATFSSSPDLANIMYRAARDAAKTCLLHIAPGMHPFASVELCFVVHDSQCVLNRHDDALWHARQARVIMDSLDPSQYHGERERFDFLAINAVIAEAVAFHNLGQYREALIRHDQADTMEAMKQRRDFWKPHVVRDRIKSLAGLPRFSITEAENLADQARAICERRNDEYDPLLLLLNSEAIARAYIRHENYKDAERILSRKLDQIDSIPNVGPLHRVLLLRTSSELCWVLRDLEGWNHHINDAYQISRKAGLQHQQVQIEAELRRGDHVKSNQRRHLTLR